MQVNRADPLIKVQALEPIREMSADDRQGWVLQRLKSIADAESELLGCYPSRSGRGLISLVN